MKEMKIGIQLYTIREVLRQNFKDVCRDLVRLGCDAVEPAFYFGDMEPLELAAFFREIGLVVCGIHTSAAEAVDPESMAYRYAEALEAPHITFSRCDRNVTDYRLLLDETIRLCRLAGQAAAAHGMRFTYHNHAGEFLPLPEGDCAFDRLMAACDPVEVSGELDVYWVKKAGGDPIAYLERYGARLPQLHMKDMSPDGDFTELGKGIIDLPGCVSAARKTACEWLIYEQDCCQGAPFDSAVTSLEYLRKINR